MREARTIARLEHPHIVPIHKVGGYRNEILYIAMRCVDGPSLRQLLERYERLSVGDAARIARQVADALAYAHRQGVVHRDIKPDNVLLDASGHVLVTDFGIAKAAYDATPAQLTTEGMVVGTPQYMSPEQATGERADDRSDIYGLGIVLYQMLTGAPPFDGESAQQILMKQATVEPVPIRQVRNDVPEALAVVLHRMLEKDPAQRYQTAEDASQAIVHALPSAARERVKVRPRVGLGGVRGRCGRGGVCAVERPAQDLRTHSHSRFGGLVRASRRSSPSRGFAPVCVCSSWGEAADACRHQPSHRRPHVSRVSDLPAGRADAALRPQVQRSQATVRRAPAHSGGGGARHTLRRPEPTGTVRGRALGCGSALMR